MLRIRDEHFVVESIGSPTLMPTGTVSSGDDAVSVSIFVIAGIGVGICLIGYLIYDKCFKPNVRKRNIMLSLNEQ
jgi:hypothetical protein